MSSQPHLLDDFTTARDIRSIYDGYDISLSRGFAVGNCKSARPFYRRSIFSDTCGGKMLYCTTTAVLQRNQRLDRRSVFAFSTLSCCFHPICIDRHHAAPVPMPHPGEGQDPRSPATRKGYASRMNAERFLGQAINGITLTPWQCRSQTRSTKEVAPRFF